MNDRLPIPAVVGTVACILFLCGPLSAFADFFRPPELVKLEGSLADPKANDDGRTVTLGRGRDTVHFRLDQLVVMNGRRSAGQILSDAEPYRPNFNLLGTDSILKRLDGAKPTDHVTIMGYLRIGSRDLMVSNVTVESAATPSPSTKGGG